MICEEGKQFFIKHFGEIEEAIVDGNTKSLIGSEETEHLIEVSWGYLL